MNLRRMRLLACSVDLGLCFHVSAIWDTFGLLRRIFILWSRPNYSLVCLISTPEFSMKQASQLQCLNRCSSEATGLNEGEVASNTCSLRLASAGIYAWRAELGRDPGTTLS